MMKNKYLAFVLDQNGRNTLIKKFPPTFEKVICHHVTILFNDVNEDTVEPWIEIGRSGENKVTVVGISVGDDIEALIVHLNGTEKRPDGGTFHITHSLTPGKRKPVDSNMLIKKKGWVKVTPIVATGHIQLVNK